MSIELFFPGPRSPQALRVGPLAGELDGFAAWLATQGYARGTGENKLRLVKHLSVWLEREGLAAEALDEECFDRFLRTRGAPRKTMFVPSARHSLRSHSGHPDLAGELRPDRNSWSVPSPSAKGETMRIGRPVLVTRVRLTSAGRKRRSKRRFLTPHCRCLPNPRLRTRQLGCGLGTPPLTGQPCSATSLSAVGKPCSGFRTSPPRRLPS